MLLSISPISDTKAMFYGTRTFAQPHLLKYIRNIQSINKAQNRHVVISRCSFFTKRIQAQD
jgi:hypothetical protein